MGHRTVIFPTQSLNELSASNERSYGPTYDRIHSKRTSLDPRICGNFLVVENIAKDNLRNGFQTDFQIPK